MPTPIAVTKAVSALRSAEGNAASSNPSDSLYTGSGREDDSAPRTKLKGKLKNKLVVILIVTLFGGGAAFLGSSNTLLAPAIEALFTEATDTQYASTSARGNFLTRYYLKKDDATTSTWWGGRKYNSMSQSFKKRLKNQGITVDKENGKRILVFETEVDGQKTRQKIKADEFNDVYTSNPKFREAYTTAKRGRLGTFFDNASSRIYKKLGISRNLFSKYKQSSDADTDMTAYRDTMKEKFEGGETQAKGKTDYQEEYEEEVKDPNSPDGFKHTDPDDLDSPIETETKLRDKDLPSGDTMTGKENNFESAKTKARGTLSKVAESAGTAASLLCTAMKVANMISVLVAANEIYQSINYYMGLSESISKMKAGEGDSSAINSVLNFMSTPAETTVPDYNKVKSSASINGTDVNGETELADLNQNGAPLESNGMRLVLAGAAPTSSTKSYSLERVSGSIGHVLATSATAASVCNAAGVATAIVSIGLTLTPGGLVKAVSGIFIKIGKAVVITAAVTALLQFVVPTIARVMFTNIFENATGIPAGELFTKGGSASNTRLGRSGSGQSLSTASAVAEYNHLNNTVLALDAELDREKYSPFDYTNKSTFMGSIAYALLPVTTSRTVTNLSTFLRTVSTSISSIIGGVHADGSGSSYMTTYGDCPELNEIGAVGDIYCNPVTTTDTSTIEMDPEYKPYVDAIQDGLKGDCSDTGNCEIDTKSDLARYISYCANRDSPFGVIDQNILGQLDRSSTGNGVVDAVLGAVPIVGDVLDIIEKTDAQKNQPWATGEYCVNKSNSPDNFWQEKGKYYQRYVEDMRLLENQGAFDSDGDGGKNPVTAYEEWYDEQYPLDTSYEGILAHYSGLTKENVETALAFIDYYYYIDHYDPESRLAISESIRHDYSGQEALISIKSDHFYLREQGISDPHIDSAVARSSAYILYATLRDQNYVA